MKIIVCFDLYLNEIDSLFSVRLSFRGTIHILIRILNILETNVGFKATCNWWETILAELLSKLRVGKCSYVSKCLLFNIRCLLSCQYFNVLEAGFSLPNLPWIHWSIKPWHCSAQCASVALKTRYKTRYWIAPTAWLCGHAFWRASSLISIL